MTSRRNINNKLNSSALVPLKPSAKEYHKGLISKQRASTSSVQVISQDNRNQGSVLAEANPEIPKLLLESASKSVNTTGKLVSNSGSNFIKMLNNFTDKPGESSVRKNIFSFVPLAMNIFAISKGLSATKDFLAGNPRQSIGNFVNAALLTLISKDFKNLALSQSSNESKQLTTNSLLKLVGFGVIEMSQQLDKGSGRLTKLAPTNSMQWGLNNLFTDMFSPIQGILSSALFGRKNNQLATPDVDVGGEPNSAYSSAMR